MPKKQKHSMKAHAPRWTDSEEACLRALAKKKPIDEISKTLGRSRGAVTAKAFILRLSLDVGDRRARVPSGYKRARARISIFNDFHNKVRSTSRLFDRQ